MLSAVRNLISFVIPFQAYISAFCLYTPKFSPLRFIKDRKQQILRNHPHISHSKLHCVLRTIFSQRLKLVPHHAHE